MELVLLCLVVSEVAGSALSAQAQCSGERLLYACAESVLLRLVVGQLAPVPALPCRPSGETLAPFCLLWAMSPTAGHLG